MNAGNSKNDDRDLKRLLNNWSVQAPVPPRFQEQVWRRIASAQLQAVPAASPWSAIKSWINSLQPRPAVAAAYVATLLTLGALLGWTQSRHASEQLSTDLRVRYLQSVDPYLANR